jgi:hypothetical protein
LEAADLGGESGDVMTTTTTTIREEMTTLTTSDSVRPAHITIYLLLDEERGGVATVDTNLQGWIGDAADEEKIWTTVMEKEKERVRARVMRRTAVAGGGAGATTTTTEVAVEVTAVAGGVDTGAPTTVTTVTMATATTMTRLNICDASTEEKERLSNLSWMHATIK